MSHSTNSDTEFESVPAEQIAIGDSIQTHDGADACEVVAISRDDMGCIVLDLAIRKDDQDAQSATNSRITLSTEESVRRVRATSPEEYIVPEAFG